MSQAQAAGQPARPGDLDTAMRAVSGVEGWLSDAQARRLFERARDAGRIVEIGSFRGRSAIVMALAAPPEAAITAIDPHAGSDRGPQEIAANPAAGDSDFTVFHRNLERAGVSERVRHVRSFSQDALDEVEGELDLLYVDGAHRFSPARDDLRAWGARVRPGGHMLIHDSFSSVGVTLAIARLLVAAREWRYLGRVGSLADYRREPMDGRRRLSNAGRQVAELPWFARNLVVKLALVLRLRPVARLLGHRSGPWPF